MLKASERRHARSAVNTIQADRRSVVLAMCAHYEHLGEMRQAEQDDRASVLSHISDMLDHPRPSDTTPRSACILTTLRSACMVLIAPVGASHASGMVSCRTIVNCKEGKQLFFTLDEN